MARLMVFTPTWVQDDGTDAIHPRCASAVKDQQIDAVWEWRIGRDNPHGIGSARNVAHQYSQARETFLSGDWDAMLTLEHDMVLPDAGAVQRLMDTPADVVYGVYMLRHGAKVLNAWRYIGDKNLGMSLSNHPDELRRARAAGVWRVSGIGHGCTLFRRAVMACIPFHDGGGAPWHPDMPFAQDALRAGVISLARFDVGVIHMDGDTGLVPFEAERTAAYIAAQTVNALAGDGSFVRLTQGQPITLTAEQAAPLIATGYLHAPVATEGEPETTELPRSEVETATAKPQRRKRA